MEERNFGNGNIRLVMLLNSMKNNEGLAEIPGLLASWVQKLAKSGF